MHSPTQSGPKGQAGQLAIASLGLSAVNLFAYGLLISRVAAYRVLVFATGGAMVLGLGSLVFAILGWVQLRRSEDRPSRGRWVWVSLAVALAYLVVLGIIAVDIAVYAWLG
jgi:hypothetical protein